ncbi:lytic transglycosylase domain-containing protein [Sphingobium indicum]|uniref:lytic transglycosylase domain-containing protein n=1 Tax=Sphingobium indicum TaxID=332055 RepID=UPI002F2B1F7C
MAQCIRDAAGGRPWLERTLWGLRDQEGGWIGAEVRNTNGSHDLGPLQVNSWWVPRIAALVGRSAADVRAWLQSDPCFNVGAARWIFLSALQVTRDYWGAVGVYHSPTRWRQRRYAWSVARHMRRRFGGDAFSVLGPTLNAVQVGGGNNDAAQATTPSVRMYGFGILEEPSI